MKVWKKYLLIVFFAIAFFLADRFGPISYLHEKKWYILGFFAALSFLQNTLISQVIGDKKGQFIQFYLTFTVIRLVASILFVGFFIWKGTANLTMFLIDFFVLYLCFTLFEIISISSNLRRFS